MTPDTDVVIIGGGPAGSTVGSLLAKYNPRLRVQILERERFPRDHVGESQLPAISPVLDEIGVWNKIEAADFPVKIGATYRWGRSPDLWDFEFLPDGKFEIESRPAKFAGQRRKTAFQVDRGRYDQILLDHAASLGCEVRQQTSVRNVLRHGDRVEGLVLDDGTRVQARYYVDATGHSGIIRRAMGVEVDCPTSLQNIAIWDYWENAEWAESIGIGGTRVLVLSLSYGWLWFIPISPNRTSIGLIVPASTYKERGLRPEELYLQAVHSEPIVDGLIQKAKREGKLASTKDWSFVADRLTGENWFLAGESAGFADPILAAGMTLAHLGARDVAYVILASERQDVDAQWAKEFYCTTHRAQIRQHIRFADFWYSANGVFSDLKDHARTIAEEAGLTMTADAAWRWLGQGGFVERFSGTDVGLYGLFFTKEIIASFTGDDVHYEIVGKSHFRLDLEGAERDWTAEMDNGRMTRRRMYRRNGKVLPLVNVMGWLAPLLKSERSYAELVDEANLYADRHRLDSEGRSGFWAVFVKSLEALVGDGWVSARTEPGAAPIPPVSLDFTSVLHDHRAFAVEQRAAQT